MNFNSQELSSLNTAIDMAKKAIEYETQGLDPVTEKFRILAERYHKFNKLQIKMEEEQ